MRGDRNVPFVNPSQVVPLAHAGSANHVVQPGSKVHRLAGWGWWWG